MLEAIKDLKKVEMNLISLGRRIDASRVRVLIDEFYLILKYDPDR